MGADTIIRFLNAHPGFDPGWDAYVADPPRNSFTGQPWTGQKLIDGYGGAWDRARNRAPGADYEGSVQQMYDWILVRQGSRPDSTVGIWHYDNFGNLGSFVPPGGPGYLSAGPPASSPEPGAGGSPGGGIGAGSGGTPSVSGVLAWAQKNPLAVAAGLVGAIVIFGRK